MYAVAIDPSDTLEPERLQRLIEVGRGLLSELHVEAVLDRVLETARELTGARFAAMGVLDADRQRLARFVTRGVDEQTHRAIGDLPHGRGILGVLIQDPRPLRLHDVNSDPRSFGFPAGHPPMATFLGVPVTIRGEAWGNLYLCEKEDGEDFNQADELSTVVLADWAAIAIENARLYEAIDGRRDELERAVRGFEATAAIAQAVGGETNLDRVLELVVKRARALVGARSVLVLLTQGDELVVEAAAGQVTPASQLLPIAESRLGDVLRDRVALRIGDVDAEPRLNSGRLGVPDASTALLMPLVYRGRALGVLCAFDRLEGPAEFDQDDEQALRAFAASAATAVATAKTVEGDRLRAAIDSAEVERRRWARELHDETLQGLGGLKVLLSAAARADDPDRLRTAVRDAVEQVSREIDNLRGLITELRPASLDALGLGPALETLVQRTRSVEGLEVTATIDVQSADDARLAPELETAVYRVAQEALTNIAKHARAHRVDVEVLRHDGQVHLTVADDGVGFDAAQPTRGFGLLGMRERMALGGGTLDVRAAGETGTRIEARFPISE
jgi:signal transduction histidine kinase